MDAQYKIGTDGSISITVNIKPEGSMLEQEEQIAAAVAEAGRLATMLSLKGFDTNGDPLVSDNVRFTSKGSEKKTIKPPGEK